LTNPAGATHQLIGVYDPDLTEPLARVLDELGSQAAYVVHGADGLDELSTTGTNRVSHLKNGEVRTFELDPQTLGFDRANVDHFKGDSPEVNAEITWNILSGQDKGSRREIVLLNAAAALSLNDNDWESGLEQAKLAIDSGAALKKLDSWIELTNQFRE
jgi:anthranilate phosphoribosyltransferase